VSECVTALRYCLAQSYSNTEYRTSTSTQPHNCASYKLERFVTQGVAIKRKMGKKCFCVTTEILHTKFRLQKHLALTGIQLQSRIKMTVSQVFVGILFLPLLCTNLVHIKKVQHYDDSNCKRFQR